MANWLSIQAAAEKYGVTEGGNPGMDSAQLFDNLFFKEGSFLKIRIRWWMLTNSIELLS